MFLVVFFWQPPHFYALAIKFKDDYARAGIPMLPVVASLRRVGLESVLYAWLTLFASLALWPFGMSWVYGVTAAVVGASSWSRRTACTGESGEATRRARCGCSIGRRRT
jgi:protoheme IX farnesyltransferase